MRYTTIIDLTEIPDVWHNPNVCRVYFYLAMKCGYHDDDRDTIRVSIRNLAFASGVTVSAARHALSALLKNDLLTKEKDAWRVTKFVLEKKPTSRTQKNTTTTISRDEEARQKELKREAEERQRRENLKKKENLVALMSADELKNAIGKIQHSPGLGCFLADGCYFVKAELPKLQEKLNQKQS